MKDKQCNSETRIRSVEEVKNVSLSINNDKPPGSDNLDGRYCHSYLPYLQFKPSRKCVLSGLDGSKSHSATQEQQSTLYWFKQSTNQLVTNPK